MGRIEKILDGLSVSPGIGIGRAVCLESRRFEVFRISIAEEDLGSEIGRLDAALVKARADVDDMRHRAGAELGAKLAGIFEAHRLLLDDPAFVGKIKELIRSEKVNAEWAVHKTAQELATLFARLESENLREKKQDLLDVSQHLLRSLGGIAHHDIGELEGPLVVVAHDLTPSEAIRLGRQRVTGFALESGGKTSHTAIIARSLHIPLVTGLAGVRERVTDETPLIVDGTSGQVVLHPSDERLQAYKARRRELRQEQERQAEIRTLPAVTTDGARIRLLANIDLPEEIDEAVGHGADGVGLYRSEFLYIERSPELPTEDEHVALYRRLLETMGERPVMVRTFDLGGRKLAREMLHTEEENPVLGLRGIRLTLARRDIFIIQVRALLRAALHGRLRVILPMIASLEEVRQFKQLVAQAAAELTDEGVEHAPELELGVMIEVPAAALIARQLAAEVSFFSIGTNDLIQYALAVDRSNEHVSHLYRPLHPAILRMVRFVVEAAEECGIDVSLCGESAADPAVAPVLIGLGVHQLSLAPGSIPVIKKVVRSLALAQLSKISQRCLDLGTAREVENLMSTELHLD